jgi:hypothetical protein
MNCAPLARSRMAVSALSRSAARFNTLMFDTALFTVA